MEFGTQCVSTDETLAVITVTSTVRTARMRLNGLARWDFTSADVSSACLRLNIWESSIDLDSVLWKFKPKSLRKWLFTKKLLVNPPHAPYNCWRLERVVDLMSKYWYSLIYWYVLVHQPHPDTERQFQLPPSFMSLFYNVFFPIADLKKPSICVWHCQASKISGS